MSNKQEPQSITWNRYKQKRLNKKAIAEQIDQGSVLKDLGILWTAKSDGLRIRFSEKKFKMPDVDY